MSKSNYTRISRDKQYAESIRSMVRAIVFEEDPKELDAYRKLIRKNVSVFRRSYLTGYLFKLLQEEGENATGLRSSSQRGTRGRRGGRDRGERGGSYGSDRGERGGSRGGRDRGERSSSYSSDRGERSSSRGGRDRGERSSSYSSDRGERGNSYSSDRGERSSSYNGDKEGNSSREPREREPRNVTPNIQNGVVSLHVNCGRMHGLTEADLRSLIEAETSPTVTASIQDIRLYDKYSFVYLDEEHAQTIIDKLTGLSKFGRSLLASYSKKNIQ